MPTYSPANPVATIAVLLCWLGFGAVLVRSRMASGGKYAAKRDLNSVFGIILLVRHGLSARRIMEDAELSTPPGV